MLATQKNASYMNLLRRRFTRPARLSSVLALLKCPTATVNVLGGGPRRARVEKYTPRTEYFMKRLRLLSPTPPSTSVEARAAGAFGRVLISIANVSHQEIFPA